MMPCTNKKASQNACEVALLERNREEKMRSMDTQPFPVVTIILNIGDKNIAKQCLC